MRSHRFLIYFRFMIHKLENIKNSQAEIWFSWCHELTFIEVNYDCLSSHKMLILFTDRRIMTWSLDISQNLNRIPKSIPTISNLWKCEFNSFISVKNKLFKIQNLFFPFYSMKFIRFLFNYNITALGFRRPYLHSTKYNSICELKFACYLLTNN